MDLKYGAKYDLEEFNIICMSKRYRIVWNSSTCSKSKPFSWCSASSEGIDVCIVTQSVSPRTGEFQIAIRLTVQWLMQVDAGWEERCILWFCGPPQGNQSLFVAHAIQLRERLLWSNGKLPWKSNWLCFTQHRRRQLAVCMHRYLMHVAGATVDENALPYQYS